MTDRGRVAGRLWAGFGGVAVAFNLQICKKALWAGRRAKVLPPVVPPPEHFDPALHHKQALG